MELPVTCYACGARASLAEGTRCDCGEPYWLSTDTDDLRWPDTDERSMWRFREVLPDGAPQALGRGAGGTPLVRAPRLDEQVGARVHVKYEAANPTGTFKDRGSAVGTAVAVANGAETVGTVSHGNMARSMAAHAASLGLECLVLVPDTIPESRLGLIARHDPTILRVQGDYGRLYHESLRMAADRPITFVNSDTPLRVAGQKTTGLEIAEAFAPTGPDAIVLPVSSGGHASGVWKGLRELRAADLLERLPPLFFVQAAACAPIARAWHRDERTVQPIEGGETLAFSIANADPPSGTRTLAAAEATGGGVISVDDDAIRAARRALSTRAGLSVESASATALAGASEAVQAGDLAAEDDIVLVATGTGFTDRGTGEADVTTETVPLQDLSSAIQDRL